MTEIKKILVPTDFSENSIHACRIAGEIASRFNSVIDLIHVIPNIKFLQENLLNIEVPLKLEEDVLPEITEKAETQIEEEMDRCVSADHRGTMFVKMDRKPSETITSHAEEDHYDLILIGARGKHESGMFRGNTTANVIRRSSVPVLSADKQAELSFPGKIMVPTDLSHLSFTAFPMAASIAGKFDSEIVLFHVLENHRYHSGKKISEELEGELESVYERLIGELVNFLRDSDISVRRTEKAFEDIVTVSNGELDHTLQLETEIMVGGSAHEEIRNYAEQFADLVVMTTHGYSGRPLLDLGSIAEKISQQVQVPVMSIRPAGNLFKKQVEGDIRSSTS